MVRESTGPSPGSCPILCHRCVEVNHGVGDNREAPLEGAEAWFGAADCSPGRHVVI